MHKVHIKVIRFPRHLVKNFYAQTSVIPSVVECPTAYSVLRRLASSVAVYFQLVVRAPESGYGYYPVYKGSRNIYYGSKYYNKGQKIVPDKI